MKVAYLLALLSGSLLAQSPPAIIQGIPVSPAKGISVPPGANIPPEMMARMAAGQPSSSSSTSSQKDPEAYRADLLSKLKFDRTPSGIQNAK